MGKIISSSGHTDWDRVSELKLFAVDRYLVSAPQIN